MYLRMLLFPSFSIPRPKCKKSVERKSDQHYREKTLHINIWNRDLKFHMYQI
jgi:hypothetical protein